MRTPRPVLLAAVSCLLLAPLARPQDSHYWTHQYGARATLLGGAVIGSVLDLSGTYYNPGGMSLVEKPDTLMAAKVFQFPFVTLAGGDGQAVPLNARDPGPAPALIAGTIRLRGLPKHWFGYSYISRQQVRLGASVSSTGVRDVLPDVAGEEDYVTQFRLDERVSEQWFGLTWSYRISKNVGLGVSQYLAVRSHRASSQELVEALDGEAGLAMALGSRQYRYRHFRTLWKIGLACDLKWITWGLTATTPGLPIAGSGSTGVNSTVVALDMDGDGDGDDFLAADYADGLTAAYRTPFSLAAGVTFKIRKVRAYWSAEWFARVRPYTVLDAAGFFAQTTGEPLSSDVTQELAAVLNTGVGLEWFYSSRFKGYASFTTDYSAKKPGTATNLSLTDWNIHHVVVGAEFFVKKWALTAGLGVSFGDREIGTRPDILDRVDVDGLWDPFESLRFRYASFRLVAGFAI
jgi:hypothetical protein